MKIIKRAAYLIYTALRNPTYALHGIREFRLDCTMHVEDYWKANSYDAGREIAHVLTFRYWDNF